MTYNNPTDDIKYKEHFLPSSKTFSLNKTSAFVILVRIQISKIIYSNVVLH